MGFIDRPIMSIANLDDMGIQLVVYNDHKRETLHKIQAINTHP